MVKTLKKTALKVNATIICKNCGNEALGNFCSNCGQSANTHKLNMHTILHYLQHGLFNFDKGILYTAKELLTRPGHTIREFLEGKRVRHSQPFSFVVVLATFYGLLYHYLVFSRVKTTLIEPADDITGASRKIVTWITENYAFDCLIMIITATFVSCVVFKKKKYNLAEHLVLNTFLIGLFLIVSLCLFPIVIFLAMPQLFNMV
jgi:ribosomal protein L32